MPLTLSATMLLGRPSIASNRPGWSSSTRTHSRAAAIFSSGKCRTLAPTKWSSSGGSTPSRPISPTIATFFTRRWVPLHQMEVPAHRRQARPVRDAMHMNEDVGHQVMLVDMAVDLRAPRDRNRLRSARPRASASCDAQREVDADDAILLF